MSDEKDTAQGEQTSAEGILHRERGLLTEFQFDELSPSNTSGATLIPLTTVNTPVTIAQLSGLKALHIDEITDRVWLTGTVGWQGITNGTGSNKATVLFKIFRDAPVTGPLIYSLQDSAEVGFDNFRSSTVNHVDLPIVSCPPLKNDVPYFLTAEITQAGSQINIIGPITFTGAEIERNRCCHPCCP
jgi:hypothetical protein